MLLLPENQVLLCETITKMCLRDDIVMAKDMKQLIFEWSKKYVDLKEPLFILNKRILSEIIHYLKEKDTRDQFIRLKEETILKDRSIDFSNVSKVEQKLEFETPRSIFEKI